MKCMQQNYSVRTWVIALFFGAIMASGASAAETTTPPTDADAKTKALEERVKQLEKRIADMEAYEAKGLAMTPKRFDFQQDDFNKMLDQMRKQMMENGVPFGREMPVPQTPGIMRHARKPALGVGVDEVSDELKTRFKNDVKEGTFVLSVYPNSAAEKAGVQIGDAITSFDGKPIANPKALIDAVKNAAKGTHELMLARHGEMLKLKVDLAAQDAAALNENPLLPGVGNGDKKMRTELRVSALEMTDSLANDLGLSSDQKKKMSDILANHAKALTEEFSKSNIASTNPGFGFSITADLSEMAKKHADNAAKELSGVLKDDQLQKWNDYRATHSSISFSQSMQMGSLGLDPRTYGVEPLVEEEAETVKF